ncbi:unnamed protein product [Arctogadus glacialis]
MLSGNRERAVAWEKNAEPARTTEQRPTESKPQPKTQDTSQSHQSGARSPAWPEGMALTERAEEERGLARAAGRNRRAVRAPHDLESSPSRYHRWSRKAVLKGAAQSVRTEEGDGEIKIFERHPKVYRELPHDSPKRINS